MFDDGLLRAAELFVAEDVLQHGMGGEGAEETGRRAKRQANTLNLIAGSALHIKR